MAIAFVGSASNVETGFAGSPVTLTLDAGASADRAILVRVSGASSSANTLGNVTYNGVTLTKSTVINEYSEYRDAIYYLAGPTVASGSNTLSFDYTGDIGTVTVVAVAYSGVASIGNVAWNTSPGSSTTTPSYTITTTSGDTAVAFAGHSVGDYPTATASTRNGSNERYDAVPTNSPSRYYVYDIVSAGASVALDWSFSSAAIYAGWELSLTPAADGVTITDAGDESYQNGETGIVITGSNFGASQGTGKVYISPTNDVDNVSRVEQTVTAWSNTSITFTAVKGGISFNTNAYLFVVTNAATANASGHIVQIAPLKYLKVLVQSSAQSATGVKGVVFQAPTGSAITGAEIGEFTDKTFSGTLESGQAVLKVLVTDFGGAALTTSDTPVVLVRNATNTTGIISATVIEE